MGVGDGVRGHTGPQGLARVRLSPGWSRERVRLGQGEQGSQELMVAWAWWWQGGERLILGWLK